MLVIELIMKHAIIHMHWLLATKLVMLQSFFGLNFC